MRAYPFAFLLPLFREIRYSDRKKWLLQKAKNRSQRATVFKTTFNYSHTRFRNVINRIMPEIDCTVCYKATVTLTTLSSVFLASCHGGEGGGGGSGAASS